MRGETRSLIGLKHIIGVAVLLCDLKIRDYVRRLDVLVFGILAAAVVCWDSAGPVHLPFVIRSNPRPFVRVFGVAGVSQIKGLERNLFGTAHAILDQVRARELVLGGKGIATKQIVRRAIFLDENDYMLNLRNVIVLLTPCHGHEACA